MVTGEHGTQDPDPGVRPGDPGPRPRAATAAQRPSGGHPDVEALDAYLDARPDAADHGFPLEPSAARVERHVRSCASCQEALTALRRVRSDLARLASMTMPADVAERIQATLAARSATDTRARETARPRPGSRTGTVGGPPRPRRRLGRIGSSASGLVAPGEFERKAGPGALSSGPAGRATGTPGAGDTAGRGAGILESGIAELGVPTSGVAEPGTAEVGTTEVGTTASGRASGGAAASPARPAGDHVDDHERGYLDEHGRPNGRVPWRGARGRRTGLAGLAGAGGRAASDWISIAATCVALVAFGAAVLTLRGLTAGTAETTSSTASRGAPTAMLETSRSGTAAAARPEASVPEDAAGATGPSGQLPASVTLVADSGESVRPGDIVGHGQSLLTRRIPTTMLTWPVLPAGSGVTSAPSLAGEEERTAEDGGGLGAAPGADRSSPSATAPSVTAPSATAPSVTTPAALARLVDTPQLRMCYDSLTAQTGGSVLALDRVRFEGQRALLVVLSVAGQPTIARVVVIDARCGVVGKPGAVLYSANATRAL